MNRPADSSGNARKLRRPNVFGQRPQIVEGWYWVIPSRKLRRGKAKAVTVMGRDLAVYRTGSGEAKIFDAYCPHMGCHLALGKVEGDCLRCFFHNWSFDAEGQCVDVPSMDQPPLGTEVRTRRATEQNGLLWVWVSDDDSSEPDHLPAEPEELSGTEFEFAVGREFRKACHPNVVMINAIDEQHFRTVHRIPGHLLEMRPESKSERVIHFANNAQLPRSTAFFRWASKFYAGPLRYELTYWYGSNGVVTMGPDFLHIYIMFALRQTAEGVAEGQTLVFTKRRRGPLGWLFNRVVLLFTKLAGNYFSAGDTKVFENIRFEYKTPVAADRAVQAFMAHLEKQTVVSGWAED